ncbi:hypothetical protein P7C71_g4885, partial [Lecanoromycetidae sp. Uapishka_2]
MSDSEPFSLITTSSHHKVFDDYEELNSGHGYDANTSLQAALRRQYPGLALTATLASNIRLLQFAASGNATADLDITDESVQRFRYFYAGNSRRGVPDQLVDGRTFAKYNYKWGTEYFILYVVQIGYVQVQYVLKEPAEGENVMSRNGVTDALIGTVGRWQKPDDKYVYVYDGFWQMSRALYDEVIKARWEDVILNEDMKKTITELMHKFFDSEEVYKELGVPWKRGVIFHGPAGNGKTISIKALMHSLFKSSGDSIPSLYVKAAPRTWDIRNIFQQARNMAPCLLIFEDIDTIVTPGSRSYFFNEVDGLENNDGIFMVASTNHLDQLDPGLSSRPSRFDRKYLFPLPSAAERILYCNYWREKLKTKPSIKFPKKLCVAIAGITQEFSFAYLKEAFVATLLAIAGRRSEKDGLSDDCDDEGGDLDDYELWREMKEQVKALREDMDTRNADLMYLHGWNDDSWKSVNKPQTILDMTVQDQSTATVPNPSINASQARFPTYPGDVQGARTQMDVLRGVADVDRDHRDVPLMTDGGMFMASGCGFDGLTIH